MTDQPIILQPGINAGLTNAEYHSEKAHLSSSNLKTLLNSPAQFYDEKILGNKRIGGGSTAAMDLGSYVHSLILEPEMVDKEFAFFKGWRKQGQDFEAFKEASNGKIIISEPQAHTGQQLARSVEACKAALGLLKGGAAELSLAAKILGVPVKMRADYINPDQGYILDVKTTRWPSDADTFRRTMRELGYELSAALYCKIAYEVYGKLFDFYWCVISKTDIETQVYKASTNTICEGSAMVEKALVLYKRCMEQQNWPQEPEDVEKNITKQFDIIEI